MNGIAIDFSNWNDSSNSHSWNGEIDDFYYQLEKWVVDNSFGIYDGVVTRELKYYIEERKK